MEGHAGQQVAHDERTIVPIAAISGGSKSLHILIPLRPSPLLILLPDHLCAFQVAVPDTNSGLRTSANIYFTVAAVGVFAW